MARKRPSAGPEKEPGYNCTGHKFDCVDAYFCHQPDKCDPGAFSCPNSYGAERRSEREPGPRAPATPPGQPPLDPRLASLAERMSRRVAAAAARLDAGPVRTGRCEEKDIWCGTRYETVCNEFDCRPGKFKCTADAFRCENGFTG